MQKLLDTSTAARPAGSPPQKSLFRIPSGVFKGRLACLYMASSSGIKLVHSDYPYHSWSTPQSIVSDSDNSTFSAGMDGQGNIYVVYTGTSKSIRFLKLSFASGAWTAGTAVDIVTVDDNYNPFFLIDGNGKFWCFFVNHNLSGDSKHYVRAKSSNDKGSSWGTGPSDIGVALSAGSNDTSYISGCRMASKLYVVYTSGRSNLNYRAYDLVNELWDAENLLHSGDFIDDDFDMAVSNDGKLGVAFAVSGVNKIYFKEYNGSVWSGAVEVESVSARSPQVAYFDNAARLFYAKHLGNGYYSLRTASYSSGVFSLSDYSPAIGTFDKVLVYDDSASGKYQDKAAAAASDSAGDVYHTESSAALDSIGDCIYFGKKSRFYTAAIVLSTVGAGGVVAWEYCDGTNWKSFTPLDGTYQFDSADKLLYFWADTESTPSDWQITSVDGYDAYWIRARVTTGFSSKPVGSQVIAASNCDDLALVREGQ